jgi:hypothetical protein
MLNTPLGTFTPWAMLDPAKFQREVHALNGHVTFDTFSVLDPLRELKQISAEAGHGVVPGTLFGVAAVGDMGRVVYDINNHL